MKTILKFRWLILIGLIALTAILFILSPNLSKQAENAGTFQLPDTAVSQKALKILEEAGAAENTISLVYALDQSVNENLQQSISTVAKQIKQLGAPVEDVLNPFQNKDLEQQLVAKDKKTVLVPITVDGTDEEIVRLAAHIQQEILTDEQTVYLTGEAIINNDVNISAQEGLKKTEIITVILIFGLLLVVFRSIITPLVPLLAVGMSYLLSQSIVAFLIAWFDFPVSNYTQIFLVAILFGLGTDYCILLLSRYKEELLAGHEVEDAIINTYRTAGRTLFISALAVFIGFAAIGFADFPIFKSAVAVAVGIAVLLSILYTIVPVFMVVLKDKIFWPSKKAAAHKDSRIWQWLSKLSVLRPLLSMLVVAIITVPILLTYDNVLSFNTVDEIDDNKDSVKGLQLISDAFGEGDSLPVQVLFKSDEHIVNESDVAYLERISKDLEKIEGVKNVRTITRPTGEMIEELYVDHQTKLMADGLDDALKGLNDVQSALRQVQSGLGQVTGQLPASSQTSQGSSSLQQAASGIGTISSQLERVAGGLQQGMPVAQATSNLTLLQRELTTIQSGLTDAANQMAGSGQQIGALSSGLTELSNGIQESNKGLQQIKDGLTDLSSMLKEMGQSTSVRDTGLFIPSGTLQEKDFQPVLDLYTIGNGTGIVLDVILEQDPYSREALQTVEEIQQTVHRSIIHTPFENMDVAFNGVSVMNYDLNDISSKDFTRTVTIMLTGLSIVLFFLFRSAIMPAYMIASLLLTYYTSISVTELIFVNWLGYDGISWAVPFFGFIMLIALGVDYSIFLLDRFREESINGLNIQEALITSMSKMGTVIITAAIILAGTFGAMIPSGVLSLIQIATVVITGLLLYGLIILPLLIPAITVSFGRGVWWPYRG